MRLTDDQNDVLTEVINIGMGRAAASLSELIGDKIDLSVPSIVVCNLAEFDHHIEVESRQLDTSVIQDFDGRVSGRAMLAFPRTSGITLGQVLAGLDERPDKLDLDLNEILEEVGNIVLNGVLGSIANLVGTGLTFSVAQVSADECVKETITSYLAGNPRKQRIALIANVQFRVASRDITGALLIVFDLDGVQTVLDSILEAESFQ